MRPLIVLFGCLSYLNISDNPSHSIVKCRKRSFRSFAHRDNNLLIRNRRNISGCIDTRHIRTAMCINHDFAQTVGFHYVAEYTAIRRKPDLYKYTIQLNQTFFFRLRSLMRRAVSLSPFPITSVVCELTNTSTFGNDLSRS